MRGRKPLPTKLKVVAGTERASRRNDAEPKPEIVRVPPPEFLSADALGEWARVEEELFNLGILSSLDRGALAAYCTAYGRWVEAERALKRMADRDKVTSGLMIKTQNGNAIQNPLVGSANKAMADMMRYAAEFGMTPAARSRISAEKGGGGGKAQDDYF